MVSDFEDVTPEEVKLLTPADVLGAQYEHGEEQVLVLIAPGAYLNKESYTDLAAKIGKDLSRLYKLDAYFAIAGNVVNVADRRQRRGD